MMNHWTALRKIFSTLKVLARQGLAIRGAENDENSNFMAMLKARAEDVSELETCLKRTGHKWLHHDIQNEILQAMATKILSDNIQKIQLATYFSILLDETADISRTEQISIYLRVVSPDLVATEYFLGFYSTINTKAETLFDIVKDVLIRFGLLISKMRGQCYDGASNMSGKISGLQQRIQEEETRALFVHCNAHNLNLVVQDGIEQVLTARKFVGEVKELINFVRDSPERLAKFQELQAEEEDNEKMVPALAAYCPTRFTLRIKSLKTVLANYEPLMAFFEGLIEDREVDSTIVAKAAGFLGRMESFSFLLLLNALIEIFDRIEVLNKELQKAELCVVDSSRKIEAVTYALEISRDSKFESIWLKSTELSKKFEIEEPNLPRRRKISKRIDSKNDNDHVFDTPKEYHRKIYCEIYDQVLCSLKSRFDTDSAKFFRTLEQFAVGETVDVKKIILFYKGDFDEFRLVSDRDMALNLMKRTKVFPKALKDIVQFMKENDWCRGLVPEYLSFIQLLITIPGSTCSNERSFSVLRRVKNYLRSTMAQDRLNHVAILHSYSEETDELDLEILMNKFISKNSKRAPIFALQQ